MKKLLLILVLGSNAKAFEVERDKVMHFGAGLAITSGVTFTASKLGAKHPKYWGFAAGVLAGVGKELYDKRHPKLHTCDPKDAYATFLGSGVAVTFRF